MKRGAYFERSLMTARELGDRRAEASALHQLGIVLQEQGRNDEARPYFERSLMTARELGDRRAEASALHQLGIVLQEQGRNDEARRLLRAVPDDRPGAGRPAG